MRVTGVLREIVANKTQELADRRRRVPLDELRSRAAAADPPRPFLAALRGPRIRLIAEVKGASPSAGAIRPEVDPAGVAPGDVGAGAAGVSGLPGARHFR